MQPKLNPQTAMLAPVPLPMQPLTPQQVQQQMQTLRRLVATAPVSIKGLATPEPKTVDRSAATGKATLALHKVK